MKVFFPRMKSIDYPREKTSNKSPPNQTKRSPKPPKTGTAGGGRTAVHSQMAVHGHMGKFNGKTQQPKEEYTARCYEKLTKLKKGIKFEKNILLSMMSTPFSRNVPPKGGPKECKNQSQITKNGTPKRFCFGWAP